MIAFAALAFPAVASAGSEYFHGTSGNWEYLGQNNVGHGARHSLTGISARHISGSNGNICVFGSTGQYGTDRNTNYYCAVSSDLASTGALGGSLRYPHVANFGANTHVRALSEW